MTCNFFDWVKGRPAEKVLLVLAVFGMMISGFWWSGSFLKIIDVTVKESSGVMRKVSLPYSVRTGNNEFLEFTVKLHKNLLTRDKVRIVPDDAVVALKVNGQRLSLDEVIDGRLDDWIGGFSYPLGRFLHAGENTVVIIVYNKGGASGLNIHGDFSDQKGLCVFIVGLCCFFYVLSVVLRRQGVSWKILGIVFMGLMVWCVYVLVTPWHERTQDVVGHIAYIEHMYTYWSIPDPYAGWSFYHPPLYYVLSAFFWKMFDFLGWARSDILKMLQFQSLIYLLGFVVLSFMTLRLAIKRISQYPQEWLEKNASGTFLGMGLLMLWPSTVIHAARIGNDALFYLLSAASFYLLVKWWIADRIGYFWAAGLLAVFGMLTKSNAVILFFLMAALFLFRWFSSQHRGWRLFIKKTWPVWVMFFAVIFFSYVRPFVDMQSGKRTHLLVGNLAELSGLGLDVDNSPKAYLLFDMKNFWQQPYTSAWEDGKGRHFFWNYLLKTSLFGEYAFSYHEVVVFLARGLSLGLIFIMLFPLFGFWRKTSPPFRMSCDFPMAFLYFLFLLSIVFFRMSAPFACAGDFRYIFPALVAVIYFYCAAIDRHWAAGNLWAARLGIVVGWGFCLLSGLFMMALVF